MYLKANKRKKDGKVHTYYSIVESERLQSGKIIQRQVLYLGEINNSQKEAWRKTIEVAEKKSQGDQVRQMSLFPDDKVTPVDDQSIVKLRLKDLSVSRPRQYGACWLAGQLWRQLELDRFWRGRLPVSRKGTDWMNVLKTLTAYALISGGSEWKLHRRWYAGSAMGDLLGEDYGLVQKDKLYRCLDKLVAHKDALFKHLRERWRDLFDASFDVLLYDLTSTYFECDPPGEGIRRFGYSRDKRGDCVQVVIALIVTPEGLPLTYEVMPGNTADSSTLRHFLARIEKLYGKANRTWIMDRGIPTEETLREMREAGASYLVGTPKGRLTKLQQTFAAMEWQEAREAVEVKLHQDGDELYVLVKSEKRVCKEKAMRRRRLKRYVKELKRIRGLKRQKRDQLLMRIGAAKKEAGQAASLIDLRLPKANEPINEQTFQFTLNREKLRERIRSEGRYLLRSNLVADDPSRLWALYMVLTQIEQAFKEIKHDLNIRPIFHQVDSRIEAHIFVGFLAYCLSVTLKRKLKAKAPGLTAKEVLEQLAEIQMVDVVVPTTDGQRIVLPRYTKPAKHHEVILQALGMRLPKQPMAYMLEPDEEQPNAREKEAALLRKMGFSEQEKAQPSASRRTQPREMRGRVRPVAGSRQMRERPWKCRGDLWDRPPVLARIRPQRPP